MFKEYTVTITPKITAYAGASVFGEYTVTAYCAVKGWGVASIE